MWGTKIDRLYQLISVGFFANNNPIVDPLACYNVFINSFAYNDACLCVDDPYLYGIWD